MDSLTLFLAQLIGLFCILMGLLILFRKDVYIAIIDGYYRDPESVFLPGLIASFLGLMVVLSHNYWGLGVLALIVTLVGWISLLKGVWLIFFPTSVVRTIDAFKLKEWSWAYGIIVLIIGAYLTYTGFSL